MTSAIILFGALWLAPQATAPLVSARIADTVRINAPDTLARDTAAAPVMHAPSDADTVRRRPKAVEVTDAYALRLKIHYYTAFTTIPFFVLQSVSGNQLYQSGGKDPAWASNLHGLSAAGLGTAFTINTVTGLWNLWDSRSNPDGRVKRWLHSGLLLASDAGFAYAGIKLGDEAKRSQSARDEHRKVAYISMSSALVGYGIMLIGDH